MGFKANVYTQTCDYLMAITCANPKCYSYPMRGSLLCGKCETQRDAAFLFTVLAGLTAILICVVKVFAIQRQIN